MGQPILQGRIQWLEEQEIEWIEDELLRLGSVVAFCHEHWPANSPDPNAKPGTSAFYRWIDSNEELRSWWANFKGRRADVLVEASQHDMDTSTEDNFRHREAKAKQARWLASRLNRKDYGDTPLVQVNNTVEIGNVLAQALEGIEGRISEADWEEVEQGSQAAVNDVRQPREMPSDPEPRRALRPVDTKADGTQVRAGRES